MALAAGLACTADGLRPPASQFGARFLLGAIDLYQDFASPVLEWSGVRCRFRPTCSRYAETVIRHDGAFIGLMRTAGRLLRCGPWTPAGTFDPP